LFFRKCGTISAILAPPSGSKDTLFEDICFSKSVDSYFVDKYETKLLGQVWIDNPSMTLNVKGVFECTPARANATCNEYDPHVRPWYVAAAPKEYRSLTGHIGGQWKV
jgi:hypothetical protein